MQPIVVTSYTEPDLDGFACAVGYAEYLNKAGTPAVVRIFGQPHIEARYLVEKYNFKIETDDNAFLERVILVDASELRDLDKFIKPEQVIEVIDHRKFNDSASFVNAKLQIELVGSAATLVTEKFYQDEVEISIPAATLLYGAIVSNTLNFRAKVTTERDRRMAEWLNEKLGLSKGFIEDMFRAKSDMTGKRLEAAIDADFAWFDFGSQKIGFAQLEMMDTEQLITSRKEEILAVLEELRQKESLDSIFISLIDLGEGLNIFVTNDLELQNILSELLDIKFIENVARRMGFIMRKEVTPLLKERLTQRNPG